MIKLRIEEQTRFMLALEKHTDIEEVILPELMSKVELGVVTRQEYTDLWQLALMYTDSDAFVPLDADFQAERLMILDRYWKELMLQLHALAPDKAKHFDLCVKLLCRIRDGKATEIDLYQVEKFEESLGNTSKDL